MKTIEEVKADKAALTKARKTPIDIKKEIKNKKDI